MTTVTTVLPGYVAGTWDIDPTHSTVSFSVRHMMVSKVRGRFNGVSGRLVTGDDLLDSSVTAEIDVNSFDTGNPQRDEHIRSADFLHATRFPTMTYRSWGLRWDGDNLVVDGELTLHGITRPVSLTVELTGFGPDPYG
ncbi:MAG: YceI family protein, partial [Actinomycetota bacterium]|nr:YceI family protein [Actinomycetota bacterium]